MVSAYVSLSTEDLQNGDALKERAAPQGGAQTPQGGAQAQTPQGPQGGAQTPPAPALGGKDKRTIATNIISAMASGAGASFATGAPILPVAAGLTAGSMAKEGAEYMGAGYTAKDSKWASSVKAGLQLATDAGVASAAAFGVNELMPAHEGEEAPVEEVA